MASWVAPMLDMLGLCVIGLLATSFVKSSADELQVGVAEPSGILCFPIDGKATFDCTATVAANQDPKITLRTIQLKNEEFPLEPLNCFPSFRPESTWNYSWIGPVNSSWEQPLPNTLKCTFTVASIRDLNFTLSASTDSKSTEKRLRILTTKVPEKLSISIGGKQDSSIIEIEEGTDATASCTAVNSKPGLILSWNPEIGLAQDSSSMSNDRGITNTSISSLVTGVRHLHGKRLTCTGLALPCTIDSTTMTASATFEIIYGPYAVNESTEQDRFNVTLTCPLISNPPIATYNWSQDGISLNCLEKACPLSANGTRTTIECTGSNPKRSTRATATIVITWKDASTKAPETSHTSLTHTLPDGTLAGIIVSILIVLAVVIIVPIIYTKKKRSKRNIGSTGQLGGSSKTDVSIGLLYDRPYNDQRQAAFGSMGADEQRKSNIGASDYSNDNSIDNVPRSRNPIAMQDVSLDDLVQNPLYS